MLHQYFSSLKQNEWCDQVHAELLPRIYCHLCVQRTDSADAPVTRAYIARLTRSLGGCPRASASRAMWTRAVSFLRLSSKRYGDGWLWPICRANALFQASVSLFVRWVLETVALKTFHVSGGNNGSCRRMRIRGRTVLVWTADNGQVPDTYVLSKYMPGRHEQTHICHDWKPTIEWVVTFKNEHTIVVKTKDVFYVNIFHQNPGKM